MWRACFLFSIAMVAHAEDLSGDVGLALTDSADGLRVIGLVRDGPGERAGIAVGDGLLAIGKVDLSGRSLGEAIPLLRGPVGSTLEVRVVRDGVERLVTLNRRDTHGKRLAYGASSCMDGDCVDGYGHGTLQRSSIRYEGWWKDGFPHGLGMRTDAEGQSIGFFEDGEPAGLVQRREGEGVGYAIWVEGESVTTDDASARCALLDGLITHRVWAVEPADKLGEEIPVPAWDGFVAARYGAYLDLVVAYDAQPDNASLDDAATAFATTAPTLDACLPQWQRTAYPWTRYRYAAQDGREVAYSGQFIRWEQRNAPGKPTVVLKHQVMDGGAMHLGIYVTARDQSWEPHGAPAPVELAESGE